MAPTPPPASTLLSDDIQLVVQLARRTLREWRTGGAAVIAGLLVTAAVVAFWPRLYRSETVVFYREGLQWSQSDAPRARRMGERFRDSLLARATLTRVIEEMKLYPTLVRSGRIAEAVEEMRLAIEFRIEQGDVFSIAYRGDSPDEAQAVTAKLAEVLIAENARLTKEQARVAGEFLDAEKRRTEAELATREAAVLEFLARHPEFATEQNPLGGSIRARTQPQATVGGAEAGALAALQREEDRLRRQLSSPGQARPQDPTLVAARDDAQEKLRAARSELAQKLGTFTEEHPDVRAAQAAVEAAQAAYDRAAAAVSAAEPRVLQGRLNEIRQEIATVRRLGSAGRPVDRGDPTRDSAVAKRIVQAEADWARLNREAAETRERFQQLENRQFVAAMTASMAASGQSSQIVVIDPAFRPVKPVGFSNGVRVFLGIVVSFMLGTLVAFAAALYQDRVLKGADLERLKIAPVLLELTRRELALEGGAAGAAGTTSVALEVPVRRAPSPPAAPRQLAVGGERGGAAGTAIAVANPEGAPTLVRVHRAAGAQAHDPRLVVLNAPESAAAAAHRVLVHRLRENGDPRAILVTSPGRGEGKSLCAANLALALAERDDAKVVLLETHHQAPAVARMFGFQPPVGASEQLEAHRTQPMLPWEAVEVSSSRLHIVAIAPESTLRPVLDGRVGLFVAAFRLAGYSHVVVDGPDALSSADVTLMQESVDALVIAVRGDVTRARVVRASIDRVGTAKLAGFAVYGSMGG